MVDLKRSDEHQLFSDIQWILKERNEALTSFFVLDNAYFFGCTAEEVKNRLDCHLQEAESDASFALLAAIEAIFRLDFDYRRKNKLKDPKSKALRRISKSPRDHFKHDVSMNKLFNVLATDDSVPRHTITFLKICFEYRNWLAHGRYWQLNIGRDKPTFSEIYQLAQTIENRLYH